jgi:hypothetical protein
MKRIVTTVVVLIFLSCCSKDVNYTGSLTVTAKGLKSYCTQCSLDTYQIGLFDPSSLQVRSFDTSNALYFYKFNNDSTVQFTNINFGNYVVAALYTGRYKVVQVKAGQTKTLDFFK